MLLMPSWGGMINGLLTLRGAWDKVRTDPVLKFMVVAITGYGMATFEGPLLSLKTVNAMAHYTDWIIAHVHVGALAWNGFLTFGMNYFLVPKLFKTKLYSLGLANLHFWVGTLGIILYTLPMLHGWVYSMGYVETIQPRWYFSLWELLRNGYRNHTTILDACYWRSTIHYRYCSLWFTMSLQPLDKVVKLRMNS